jgi:H+-translocating NAD(P) transhydrogenase subunit alpha
MQSCWGLRKSRMEQVVSFLGQHIQLIYIILLSIFVGVEIIAKIPAALHTPLMSGANAIHGVVIIGAIIVMGHAEADNWPALLLGFAAVVLGTLNVVGGFVVTDRMLEMFKKKK